MVRPKMARRVFFMGAVPCECVGSGDGVADVALAGRVDLALALDVDAAITQVGDAASQRAGAEQRGGFDTGDGASLKQMSADLAGLRGQLVENCLEIDAIRTGRQVDVGLLFHGVPQEELLTSKG
eukprot:TRINITY_DN19154_c0_g1_i6.p1 TRINITY_DN19154_c0_g1~~TRINITY_DN19154_c0_g1_i6.p1  ORF type:complete len:125 (+),score=21.11 TRINITY_DN19154_c0_g1_i6:294-668(+)